MASVPKFSPVRAPVSEFSPKKTLVPEFSPYRAPDPEFSPVRAPVLEFSPVKTLVPEFSPYRAPVLKLGLKRASDSKFGPERLSAPYQSPVQASAYKLSLVPALASELHQDPALVQESAAECPPVFLTPLLSLDLRFVTELNQERCPVPTSGTAPTPVPESAPRNVVPKAILEYHNRAQFSAIFSLGTQNRFRSHPRAQPRSRSLYACSSLVYLGSICFALVGVSSTLVGLGFLQSALVGACSTLVGFGFLRFALVGVSSTLVGFSFFCSALAGFLVCRLCLPPLDLRCMDLALRSHPPPVPPLLHLSTGLCCYCWSVWKPLLREGVLSQSPVENCI